MRTGAPPSGQTLQRVKVGMIGLAAIVLLIGLASAIFSAANRDRANPADLVNTQLALNVVDANLVAPADESLAEIGVTPGSVDANAATPGPRQR